MKKLIFAIALIYISNAKSASAADFSVLVHDEKDVAYHMLFQYFDDNSTALTIFTQDSYAPKITRVIEQFERLNNIYVEVIELNSGSLQLMRSHMKVYINDPEDMSDPVPPRDYTGQHTPNKN